jgi:Fe-S cluster assembly ATP-binding protein
VLTIENLSYAVSEDGGTRQIVQDLSLALADNRFVVITGPNGGGKTTLAKLIMGLEKPTAGRILWKEQDITALSVTERARLGISYGFQQPPRFKGMTVYDLLKIASGRDMTRLECCDYLTRVGLCARDYVDRDMDDSLSGGEAKRIEIATILARHSGLMIFDEPEAGIDLWSFSKLTETFSAIREQRNATLIVISHQERLIALADEIVLIDGGRVAAQGSGEEIYPQILGQTVSSCARMGEEGGQGQC